MRFVAFVRLLLDRRTRHGLQEICTGRSALVAQGYERGNPVEFRHLKIDAAELVEPGVPPFLFPNQTVLK